jgi:hypothetical protein
MATLLSYALTSVADVKETLGISSGDSTQNNLITRKINQATEIIEGYCQRRFKEQALITEYHEGSRTDELVLLQRPVTDATPFVLSARDTALNDNDFNTVDANQYFVDANAGIVRAVSTFYGHWDRWKVVYSAGYATIPSDLAEAAVTLAAYLVSNGGSGQAVKRTREGQREVEYQAASQGEDLLGELGIQATLNRYANTVI